MFVFQDVRFLDFLSISDLYIPHGMVVSLVGESGSGKTTVLRLLNKMISPNHGKIFFQEEDLSMINSIEHRRKVVMLSQTPVMFGETVKDSLLAGIIFQEKTIPKDEELDSMLDKLKIKKKLEQNILTLSGGEKQRLALARILLLDPEVLLLDEPSSALDEETANSIIQMTTKFAKEKNKTVVMVTHSKQMADKYSDVIVEMPSAKIVSGARLWTV
ncbi:MAG: ATP-binding cassette domain-containing protein [Candidatus Margulisbacteria bacterium]|nr:ATP-binding cassette domain-containing protein [Candidatus Margulisiibacteriota bacterium]